MSSLRFIAYILVVSALVSGCSKKDGLYIEKSVGELYNDAMDAMAENRFNDAVKHFDEVERQHPYSPWASKAMLMSAYANFQVREYDKSVNSLESFIQLHPGHEDIAYAYYMVALNYYDQISAIDHDQKMTEKSERALDDVIRRFPESQYARDSRLKMALARDHLAGKNLDVGRYYAKVGAVVAAIGRFNKIVQNFDNTSSIEEALYRLVECYLTIGLDDQAFACASVLGHNYPGSRWYSKAYQIITQHAPHLLKSNADR